MLLSLAIYSENFRVGVYTPYYSILFHWCACALVLAPFSCLLYFASFKWEKQFNQLRFVWAAYLLSFLFLLPWHVFNAITAMLTSTRHITFIDRVLDYENSVCLFRFSAITAVFAAVLSIRLWQQNQARLHAFNEQREQSLRLRLELEQQSLAALKAQLEPHFMFNALNALSALVRTEKSESALNAIQKLSDLLRYALSASEKISVRLEEEITFVQDYLSLQKLRYGERLHVHFLGLDEKILDSECPPLLLQPLIENALRHDLECHADASDILLEFKDKETGFQLTISNPLRSGAVENSGFGLGLKTIRARLASQYFGRAQLSTHIQAKHFFVVLFLPYE